MWETKPRVPGPYIFFSAHKPTLKGIQLEMPVALHPDMQTSHRKCQCLQSLCFSPHFLDFKNNFFYVVLDFLKKKKFHPWFYGFDWLCTACWLLGTKLLDAAVKLPLFLSVYGAATLELRLPKKPVRRFPSFCPLQTHKTGAAGTLHWAEGKSSRPGILLLTPRWEGCPKQTVGNSEKSGKRGTKSPTQ